MDKRYFLFFIYTICAQALDEGSFTVPAPISSTFKAFTSVFSCYNSQMNQVTFSWREDSAYRGYYSTYDYTTSSFSTPAQITGSIANGIYASYNNKSNQIFFSWTDSNTSLPKYSIYDCATSSFITSNQSIPGDISADSFDVISCYNQQTNEIFFSWSENSTLQPYYAIYNCNLSTFTRTATLLSSTITVKQNIACCYNAKMNQIIFNWANFNENLNPYYAIYDCNTSSITTPATMITSSSIPDQDVFSSYIILNNEVVFSWIDDNSSTPYFAIYNCTNQSFTTPATQFSDIQGSTYILSSYNSDLDQVVFSFPNATNLKPYYAIYDCKHRLFSVHPTLIAENIKTEGLISTSYNNTINQTIFSWPDFSDGANQLPYYTIYTYPTNNHSGKRKKLKKGALHSWSHWIIQKGTTNN